MTQNLNLHHDTGILGSESEPFTVVPSHTIYYNCYPYRVRFDSDKYTGETPNVDDMLNFSEKQHDYNNSFLKDKWSVRSVKSKWFDLYCYIRSFEDYNTLLSQFEPYIKYVSGPINDEHFRLLKQREYHVEPRSTLYYKKYDAKVFLFLPYRNMGNLTKDEKGVLQEGLVSSLKENIPENSIRFNKEYFKGWARVEFYTVLEDFNQYLPFLRMMYNDWVFRITKCIIY